MRKLAIVESLGRTVNRVGFKLKKHSPEILVVTGIVGAVASAVMACKATTKLSDITEEAKEKIDDIHADIENGTQTEEDSNGGSFVNQEFVPMKNPQDLYIITTAMKRDSHEWDFELANYRMSVHPDKNELYPRQIVVIDSWNNIKKYGEIQRGFFIFDEDRVTGSGAWVKAFQKIAKNNNWIILSATPGDCWADYIPVFVANGFYKNKTEFCREHVVYSRFTKYPQIDRYLNTGRLLRLRNNILVDMDFSTVTVFRRQPIEIR